MDTFFTVIIFLIPAALLTFGILRLQYESKRAAEAAYEKNRPLTFEEKVERELARKQERAAIRKEVERRLADLDQ